jgi:hypothetical protein
MARGDHLYVDRAGGVYSHHAIDCGDGTVIHYWPDEVPFSSSIKRTTLSEFAEGGSVRVRDYAECDSPEVVIRRAVSSLGARDFDPLTSNCEHFAVWCKTGRVESSQVRSAESYLRGQPGAAAIILMLSPMVAPVLVFAVFIGNVLGGLAGESHDGRH